MRARTAESGYNLVMLMVLLTVLNIAIAASLPSWSGVIRREKEEELIFRGLQYAEAIRIFQNRFQRPPIRLQELIEVEPRSIRRLWEDPMTEGGKWVLIPLEGASTPLTPQVAGQQGEEGQPQEEEEGGDGEEGAGGGFGGPRKEEIQIGPFKGVHSRSSKTSFLVFNGRDRYDEWHFTVELLLNPASQGQGAAASGPGGDPAMPVGGQLQMSARWIGRPFPEFLTPGQGTGLPDSGLDDPNGRQGQGGQGGARKPTGGTGKP
jgi:type II secretory pathway pseudopilin PulG